VRAFIEQYPNSPHKADAQTIVDQLERQKLDAEQRTKQERAQHAQAPNDANSRGITLFKAQRYEEAIASFAEAIRLKPDLANAYFNRGAAYYKLGQFQSAISDFDQTLALDPQDQSAALQKQQAKKRLAGGVYFAGKDVTAPVYVTWANPKYSKEAIRAGKTGTVLLTFVVDEYGRVKDCQVLKSLTPDLDGRAIYAASHATFKPGKKRGKPVPVEVTVEVKFDQP
jgi:TonB family protein